MHNNSVFIKYINKYVSYLEKILNILQSIFLHFIFIFIFCSGLSESN